MQSPLEVVSWFVVGHPNGRYAPADEAISFTERQNSASQISRSSRQVGWWLDRMTTSENIPRPGYRGCGTENDMKETAYHLVMCLAGPRLEAVRLWRNDRCHSTWISRPDRNSPRASGGLDRAGVWYSTERENVRTK